MTNTQNIVRKKKIVYNPYTVENNFKLYRLFQKITSIIQFALNI